MRRKQESQEEEQEHGPAQLGQLGWALTNVADSVGTGGATQGCVGTEVDGRQDLALMERCKCLAAAARTVSRRYNALWQR